MELTDNALRYGKKLTRTQTTTMLLMLFCVGVVCINIVLPRELLLIGFTALVLGAIIVAMGLGVLQQFILSLLPFSFVLSGMRSHAGFAVLEPSQIVMMFCYISWAGELLSNRRFEMRIDNLGLFGLLVVITAWTSAFGALDLITWLKRAMRITWLFGMYLFFVSHVRNRQQLITVLRASLIACAFSSAILVMQVLLHIRAGASFDMVTWERLNGTFANVNEASTYIAMFVILSISLYARKVHREVMRLSMFIVTSGLSALSLFLHRSRSGLAAAVVATLIFLSNKRVRILALIVILLLVFLWSFPATQFFLGRITSTFGISDDVSHMHYLEGSAVERILLLQIYWQAIKACPVFGFGAGCYEFMGELNIEVPVPLSLEGMGDYYNHIIGFSSHNGFVNWWAETGTVGLLAFIASLFYCIVVLKRVFFSHKQSDWWKALSLGLIGAIFVFCSINIFGDFGVSDVRYWFLLALTSIIFQVSKRERLT